ncbi:hypothetical protein ETB97_002929 [Aspergillus alliaceus]|uniref:Uncharacterized protein n=1 Tax=Petromyces alliaceus TaxID=209559 RepID=A0A8H6A3C9_PETAA|nr:hypothetical protein ETB97_002929 [Aspergillus burnettii]
MVTLKRFFHAERTPSTNSRDSTTQATNTPDSDVSSSARTSQYLGMDHPFQRIEKQFESLHDQFQARPLSPRSPAPPSRASSRATAKSPRHVDLLEALFSSHRYHIQSVQTLSPISPYNEDIAERNMTRFLQGQSGKPTVYSRIISALHQEDVADRNIARNRNGGRPSSRNNATRSRGNSFQRNAQSPRDEARCCPRSRAECRLTRSMSQEAPRSMAPHTDQATASPQGVSSASEGSLRQQRSVPNMSAETTNGSPRKTESRSSEFLGVPPAYKQGDTWSNTPLPDSPTLPAIVTETNERQPGRDPSSGSSRSRSSSLTSHSHTPPNTMKSKSKKNVRDLSIDTKLAARGKPTAKITHRAIQPPTPSNLGIKAAPSIAEVMNSPLPAATPTSPSPALQSDQKIAEIMDMFRQAYTSSTAISPHPTYETLQDAIIREINSHEAFRRVPLPEPGPPFTPSPSQDVFSPDLEAPRRSSDMNRTMSLREGQISKLIRRGSFKKHRRGSEARKSISTSVPSKVFWRSSEASRRRRHTDAPPPSPGFFNTLEQNRQTPQAQVTCVDLLKSKESSASISSGDVPKMGRNLRSPGPVPLAGFSESSNPAPSIFHMRAQASPSSITSRISFSADDSDEEVIELPSVGVPQLQIHAVDENNVTYITDNTTPRNAFRLMSWPQRSGRSLSLRGNFFSNENNSSPSRSSSRGELTTRSVASY